MSRTLSEVFSLLYPEFAAHDPDGSTFETWKRVMRNWRRKGPQRRYQGNARYHPSGNGPSPPTTLGTLQPLKVMVLGLRLLPVLPAHLSVPSSACARAAFGPSYVL